MKKSKGLLSLLLICIILLTMSGSLHMNAINTNSYGYGNSRYNIMLVIDRSQSLIYSDVSENRFNALQYMFATLPSEGNEIGAIVFRETVKEVSPLKLISSEGDKDELFKKIRAEKPERGGTDYGAALLLAVDRLVERQAEQESEYGKYLESVIILFTDGQTDVTDKEASKAKRDLAIETAKRNGIKVFGVFLNYNNEIEENQEVFDIVRNVRNRADDPITPRNEKGLLNSLGWNYSEIISADDIVESFADLVHLLTDYQVPPHKETVPIRKECIIPAIGVSELNISVRYSPGVLQKISIKIERPDGSILEDSSTRDVIVTVTNVFYNVKVLNPGAGKWIITVDKAGNEQVTENIEVTPDIIISTNISAHLDHQTPNGGIFLREPVTFISWLEQAGRSVDDNSKYLFYECTLNISNLRTNQTNEIPMKLNGQGCFIADVAFNDYDRYYVFAVYSCDRIRFRSEGLTLLATNRPPVVNPNPINDVYTWLNGCIFTVDLSKYVIDPEGGKLSYTIRGGDCSKAASIDDKGNLTVDTRNHSGTGQIQLRVQDDQGEHVDFSLVFVVKPPIVDPNPIQERFSYSWLSNTLLEIDLSSYVTDPEGGMLIFAITDSDFATVSVTDNGILSVDIKGHSEIERIWLNVQDEQGEIVDFEFELNVNNYSLWLTLGLIVVILVILLGVLYLTLRLFGDNLDAKVQIEIVNSPVREIRQQMYGTPLSVTLASVSRPPVSLYAVCLAYVEKVPDRDAKDELNSLFRENEQRLKRYKFKRVPGTDLAKFAFQEGNNKPEIRNRNTSFNKNIELHDRSVLRLSCEARKNKVPDDF